LCYIYRSDYAPRTDFFWSFAEEERALDAGLCWRWPTVAEGAGQIEPSFRGWCDAISENLHVEETNESENGEQGEDDGEWRRERCGAWVGLVASALPGVEKGQDARSRTQMVADTFHEACRRSAGVNLEEGAQLAAEWGRDRETVEAAFCENSTIMRSWYLDERELFGLKIEAGDLFELPVWQLMGLIVKHEVGAVIVRRLVLMLDHSRCVCKLDGDEEAARVWETERDRCLVAAGFTNVVYCLVLNTQIYHEHQEFLR
jgi:hypothetical protein